MAFAAVHGAERRRLPGMDTARVLASVLVVVGHALAFVNELPPERGGGVTLGNFTPGFGAFLLLYVAGFMTFYVGWNRFGQPGASGKYLTARLTRVVPLYWAFTTLWLAIALLLPGATSGATPDAAHIVTSYLFIPFARGDGDIRPILSLGWTLNYIVLFYLVAAALLPLGRKRALTILAAGTAILLAVHPFLRWSTILHFWSSSFILMYVAGAGAAYLYKTRIEPRGLSIGAWPSAILIVLLLIAVMPLVRLWGETDETALTLPFLGMFAIATALIAICLLTVEKGGAVAKVRDEVALSSYSLYLSHPFVLGIGIELWKALGLYNYLPGSALFAALLLGSLIAAWILYYIVERPLVRFLGKRFGSQEARAPRAPDPVGGLAEVKDAAR